MKSLRIAITLQGHQHAYSAQFGTGILQNTRLFYDLMRTLGHEVFFLVPNHTENLAQYFSGQEQIIDINEAVQTGMHIDVVLEAGHNLLDEQRQQIRKACGSKFVTIMLGNALVMDIQEIFVRESIVGIVHSTGADEVWISPHFEKSASYLNTIYRAPVKICPYLWEPRIVQKRLAQSDIPDTPDIYVMEPNLDVMKTALIPIAIIERLFREVPDSFGRAVILTGHPFQSRTYFLDNIGVHFNSVHSVAEKVYFSGRCPFEDVFKRADILISHQWECELNYLYMEALYKGVPLVHNSPRLKQVGFYYPEFDVEAGENACKRAMEQYDMDEYHQRNDAFLSQFALDCPQVQDRYQALLEGLVMGSKSQ